MITREQIVGLLKVAACPASCDNGVVVRDQLHGEIEQCQFCFERVRAIAALQAAEPVAEVRHTPPDADGVVDGYCVTLGEFDLCNIPDGTKLFTLPCPPAKAQVPDEREAFETWVGSHYYLQELTLEREMGGDYSEQELEHSWEAWEARAMLTASPAPDHAADVRKMVAPDVSELEKAAQKLWRESYNCESDFIQAVVDALSKQEEESNDRNN